MFTKLCTTMSSADAHVAARLQHVFLKLNERCNAKCSFCPCWTVEHDTLAVDVFALADELKGLKTTEVNLSGGEVLLFKGFWELLERPQGGVPWSITTNGSVMASLAKVRRLEGAGVRRLYVSLDSHLPELHDASRVMPGIFDAIMASVGAIRSSSWQVELIVNHVVTNKNAAAVADCVQTLIERGFDAVNLIPIKGAPDLYLSNADIGAYYQSLTDALSRSTITRDMFVNHNFELFGKGAEDFRAAETGTYNFSYKSGCAVPSFSMFVDCSTGRVFPCDTTYWRDDAERYVMGNAGSQTLQEIWNGVAFRRFRGEMFPSIKHPCAKQCDPNNIAADALSAHAGVRLPLLA